jgi:hypothetical protein
VRSPGNRRFAPIITIVALAVMLTLSGCQFGDSDPPEPAGDAATLLVTTDHGDVLLLKEPVAPGRSVLRSLRDAAPIETDYGGEFVSKIFDRASDRDARRDWFFFLDGVLSPVGARQRSIEDGQHVWWDHRPWQTVRDPWATVGAWPAPFDGREVVADPPLATALAASGATLVEDSSWRVIVGADASLRDRNQAWRQAMDDPEAAGMTAFIEDDTVFSLPEDGGRHQPVPGGAAMAVAVPTGIDQLKGVTLAVSGVTSAAAIAAAARIAQEPEVLEDRYAVVFDERGVPLLAAGQGEP